MSKIYFQGTFGAYSHLAALEIDPKAEVIPCKTFDECFLKTSQDKNSRMIIPESNRITGNIGIEYLIFKYRLNIYAEHFHKIEHNLLGQPDSNLSDIKDVYSHSQGLSQCSKFIKKNNLVEHIRADTAGSAETISKTKIKTEAAIASSLSAEIYDLKILSKNNKNIYHHIGIYSYKTSILKKFVSLDQTLSEKQNKLEQLRALDNNLKISVALANFSPIGVDTKEDYLAIKKIMEYKS